MNPIRKRINELETERSWIYGRTGGLLAEHERERLGEISDELQQLWERWNQERAGRTAAREA